MRVQHKFQPDRLSQARELGLLNKSELANRAELTRQAISQYERGEISPSPDKVRILAEKLGVEERFFYRPLADIERSRETPINFRSLASSQARERHHAKAVLELLASVTGEFLKHVELPKQRLPKFDIEDFTELSSDEIEELAGKTRQALGIGFGPISNLTLLLENHGVLIGLCQLKEKLDGLSAWYGGHPLILVNSKAKAVRYRFDLAHELAHLILHRDLTELDRENKHLFKVIEQQAHDFAGAFLMPEKTFLPEIYGIDFDSLIRQKMHWKISIAAIIMRLKKLNYISETQAQRRFQILAANNARRHEPLDDTMSREVPVLFKRVIELLEEGNILTGAELKKSIGVSKNFLAELLSIPVEALTTKSIPDNVIIMRR